MGNEAYQERDAAICDYKLFERYDFWLRGPEWAEDAPGDDNDGKKLSQEAFARLLKQKLAVHRRRGAGAFPSVRVTAPDEGDGAAEVVYNDECFLHIYDGRDGSEVLSAPRPNSSRTGLEYPLVVDVDRDGNSEIVVPANRDQAVRRDNCPAAYAAAFGVPEGELPAEFAIGTRGVYAFGDPGDRWVRTRPIWNQYAYHVTNVTDRGDVPMSEPDNWSVAGLNNYRQNVQGAGVFNAPNLVVTLDATAACARREIVLSAVVTNMGSRGVPAGVPVQIVQTVPGPEVTILDGATTGPLLPGQSERITVTASSVPTDTDLTFEVRVDGEDAAAECVEDDNGAVAMENCPGIG